MGIGIRIKNKAEENKIKRGNLSLVYVDFPIIQQNSDGFFHLSNPHLIIGKCVYNIPTHEQRSIKFRFRERYVQGSEYAYIVNTQHGLRIITTSNGNIENMVGGFMQLQVIFNPWINRVYHDNEAYENLQGLGLPEEQIKKLKKLENKLV